MSLPSRTYTEIFEATGSRGRRELVTFYWLLSQYSTCFLFFFFSSSFLSKHFFARVVDFTFNKMGLRAQDVFFSPPLPPHFWSILCFLPQALADKIGIGCSLVRGDYGRAWNEVQLMNESRKGLIGALPPPEVYIVDLMFHPGGLMKLRSREADLYRYL